MDASFSVDCLDGAFKDYGMPEIFKTDQGSQFTSDNFTGLLQHHRITISMGRYLLLQYLHSPHSCGLRSRSWLGQYLCN